MGIYKKFIFNALLFCCVQLTLRYNRWMYKQSTFFAPWAKAKLNSLACEPPTVNLNSLSGLSVAEISLFKDSIKRFNFVIYELENAANNIAQNLQLLGSALGLKSLDNHLCVAEDKMTKIFNSSDESQSYYIPYTNKSINWHTDGYYNCADQKVCAFILHCVRAAFEGGSNSLMDQDQVFIHLMQQEPLYITALMDDRVMTIPENVKDGIVIRPATSTAIFKVLNDRHDILMRYSMRKKNIQFKQDTVTQEALACMDAFINSAASPHSTIKLKAGQGVVCNNVLHKRTAFKDKAGLERLYYRARYYNRINIKKQGDPQCCG